MRWKTRIDDVTVVRACLQLHAGISRDSGYEVLLKTGKPGKVVLNAINRCISKGLLEDGVSPRCAWPTEKGMALLAEAGADAAPTIWGPIPIGGV